MKNLSYQSARRKKFIPNRSCHLLRDRINKVAAEEHWILLEGKNIHTLAPLLQAGRPQPRVLEVFIEKKCGSCMEKAESILYFRKAAVWATKTATEIDAS